MYITTLKYKSSQNRVDSIRYFSITGLCRLAIVCRVTTNLVNYCVT